MSCQNQLGSKDPDEQVIVTFDFSPALNTGETLTSPIVKSIETIAGTDPAPTALWNGAAAVSLSGLTVQQPVKAGLDGCYYQMKMTCATTAGRTLVVSAVLPIASTS